MEELTPVDVAAVAAAATTGLQDDQWEVDEMQRRKVCAGARGRGGGEDRLTT